MIYDQKAVGQCGPWFRKRPRLAIEIASMLAIGVWGLGLALPGNQAALVALFALPIALLAVTFGRRGGAIAGISAMPLIVAWGMTAGSSGVGPSGWANATAMLMLGTLLGGAVDGLDVRDQRVRHAHDTRRRLDEVARRHREAVDINDTLVQSVVAAKWALEQGDVERSREILEETVRVGQRLVTALFNGERPVLADCQPATTSGAQPLRVQ